MLCRSMAPLLILMAAIIHGIAGFEMLPATLSWKSTVQRPNRGRSAARPGRSLHSLRAEVNFREMTTRKLKSTANEDAAFGGEYSPREGEQAPPLRKIFPDSNKIQLMSPSQYLSALTECAKELKTQGLDAVWVGCGQDSFYHALAVQLHNAGITRPVGSTGSTGSVGPKGYDYTAATSGLEGTFPAACRQIRLDLVRCIISNVERLGQFAVGAERDLHAAAMRYQVRIVCFEVSDQGKIKQENYLPQEGVEPRADLFLIRRGEHFMSARSQQDPKSDKVGAERIFCNIDDEKVLAEMREKAQYMSLKFEEDDVTADVQQNQERNAVQGEASGDAEVYTWAGGPPKDVRGGRRLLREVVKMQANAVLDMPKKHYTAGGNNFFNALAAELQRSNVQVKARSVQIGKPGSGSILDIDSAARLARSEVIMYLSAHASRFEGTPSPQKELAAAADKFMLQITCFELIKGVVSKNVYSPKEGVTARAELLLGCDGDKFWATLPSQQTVDADREPVEVREIMEIPAGADIPVGYESEDEEESQPAASSSVEQLKSINEEGDGSPPEERSVVFDKKTLSWKMMTKEEQEQSQAEMATDKPAPDPMAGKSGNYLPRFSKFRDNPNSAAPPSSKATVADAMLAGQISSRNGRVNVDPVALANRRASAGITNDVQLSEGMLQLEAQLAEQGKLIDLNQGGGNAYLVIAELMYTHKLQIQGLMFSMWGEERRKSLVGAMSRKAREDVKTYMYHNPDAFEKAGQWVGDHDCLAMARCYKIRIVVSRVIYNDQIEEHVYEPEEGTEPRGTLHVVLDRKLFWAVKSEEVWAKQDEEEVEAEDAEPVPKKPRSALEKVMAKYGNKEEEPMPKIEVVQKTKSDTGEKTIIGFEDVHVVKAVRDHSATVIWLHGLGGEGQEWMSMAEALHMPWAKFIFPKSRPVPLELWDGQRESAWFDLSPGTYQVHCNSMNAVPSVISRIYSKIQADDGNIDTSAALVQELVRQEIKNGISPDRIILAGFSQGATIALHAALSMEEQVGGVVGLSMWHLPSITSAEAVRGAEGKGKMPILVCHGMQDHVIKSDFAQHMCAELSAELDVTYQPFDSLAHGICTDELSAVRKFMLDKLPGQTKYDSVSRLPPIYRRHDGSTLKSSAKLWGDGSEVSARRSDAEFQALAREDKAALEVMVEEAVRNNLEDFASNFQDPGANLWADLRRSVHEKSKKQRQK